MLVIRGIKIRNISAKEHVQHEIKLSNHLKNKNIQRELTTLD